MKKLLLAFTALTLTLSAADVNGTWKGTADTPNGPIERMFTFKADGAKVTGETTSQMMGKSEITDGKLDGDTLTFSIVIKFQDNEMTVKYTGKVEGDTIKFSVDGGQFQIEYLAKKVQ